MPAWLPSQREIRGLGLALTLALVALFLVRTVFRGFAVGSGYRRRYRARRPSAQLTRRTLDRAERRRWADVKNPNLLAIVALTIGVRMIMIRAAQESRRTGPE